MSDDPVPAYFSLRYVMWLMWTNALTILMTLQGIFTGLTLDEKYMSQAAAHGCLLISFVLGVIVAQIKKNHPPGEPPTKAPLVQSQETTK